MPSILPRKALVRREPMRICPSKKLPCTIHIGFRVSRLLPVKPLKPMCINHTALKTYRSHCNLLAFSRTCVNRALTAAASVAQIHRSLTLIFGAEFLSNPRPKFADLRRPTLATSKSEMCCRSSTLASGKHW